MVCEGGEEGAGFTGGGGEAMKAEPKWTTLEALGYLVLVLFGLWLFSH